MRSTYVNFFGPNSKIRYGFPRGNGKKVLILTPHADDETIGCGGTISYLQKRGYGVVVLLFTLPDYSQEENAEYCIRLGEFTKSMEYLYCSNEIMHNIPDGELSSYKDGARERLEEVICRLNPSIIFTPYVMDFHADHKCVSKLLSDVVKGRDLYIAMYEVWVPILHPNYYIDISEFWEKKQEALLVYTSQIEQYSILSKAEHLNQLRAQLSMRRNVKYIEAFKVIKPEELIEITELF